MGCRAPRTRLERGGYEAAAMADAEASSGYDIKMLKTDMPESMVTFLKALTEEAFKKSPVPKDVAAHVKAKFEAEYPPADNKATSGVYHCVAGTNFACSVTAETGCSAYWSCNGVHMLLYKSKDSPFGAL